MALHVGIIPDGNRRWMRKNRLNIFTAYSRGAKKVEEVMKYLFEERDDVSYVTIYVFSLKNFERDEKEKKVIFSVISSYIDKIFDFAMRNKIKIIPAGRLERFPDYLYQKFKKISKETEKFDGKAIVLLLGYDSDDDIDQAARKSKGKLSYRNFTYIPPEIPPVDLLVRTSGEQRISGFPLYLISYSELFFLKPLWPEITKEDLNNVFKEFYKRERRFGK